MIYDRYFERVNEAATFLKGKVKESPKLILVLSGGLSHLVHDLTDTHIFKSSEIPHFPKARVEGHAGELIFGRYKNSPVVVLKGRYHFYEGLTPQEVVFPYFVLHALGAETLVTTNAVGGIRADLDAGDVMVLTDHINMMGTNPLIGLSIQRPQDQFPSMQQAYDPELMRLAKEIAKKQNLNLKEGVYLANPGPSYETPAEIRAYRSLGADSIGMSTVFEVIAARFLKMRVLTFSIVTNPSADRHAGEMRHEEVLQVMQKAEGKVVDLLRGVLTDIAKPVY
ncbi:MAG: purine-nucleoside phosphorylase [Deltaproteobacteria bacterium]|nr:purine-nucleoside phosphorylase [Deltaproteobacteria bacterium]